MTTEILLGHVLDRLRDLPDESVHMVWTSPPYWGLRAYGTEPQVWGGDPECAHEWHDATVVDSRHLPETNPSKKQSTNEGSIQRGIKPGAFCLLCNAWKGEHGQEPTLELWIAHEAEIFREVRRVLRSDGTLWLNIGDAYCSSSNGRPAADIEADNRTFRDKPFDTAEASGLKPKQRLLLPSRLALALQMDGWWVRDEIVWSKANPMPSSVRDRTTPAHEMLYMLTKAPRYYYDGVAIREAFADDRQGRDGPTTIGGERGRGGRTDGYTKPNGIDPSANGGRNKRSVWSLALEPYSGAHFATAPTGIVRPCILAGTSAKGVCPHCGAPWVRKTEKGEARLASGRNGEPHSKAYGRLTTDSVDGLTAAGTSGSGFASVTRDTGSWQSSCDCPEHEPIPATVLDPFGGAGTTGLVSEELGRDSLLIELSADYAEIARSRLRKNLGRVKSDAPEADSGDGLPLFSTEAAE